MALRCFLLITKISHCWWLVHVAYRLTLAPLTVTFSSVSHTGVVNFPDSYSCVTPFQFWFEVRGHVLLIGPHWPTCIYFSCLCVVEEKVAHNNLWPAHSNSGVRIQTLECGAVILPGVILAALHKETFMSLCIPWIVTQIVNFDAEVFPFLGNIFCGKESSFKYDRQPSLPNAVRSYRL
jgi:hypothetical protein